MEEEGGKLVECALTERAVKKLKEDKKPPRSERKDGDKDEAAGGEGESRGNLPPPRERGVVYLGHIPHGFYEEEMKNYFSQFGTVTRLKLYRSKKTGRSRGFAFIEFEFPEVAEIAAESMNNYLMFNRLLKCRVVEPGKVSRRMLTPDVGVASVEKTRRKAQKVHNKPRTVAEVQKRVSRLLSRENRKRKRLEELGLDYDFAGYRRLCQTSAAAKTPSHVFFTDEHEDEEEAMEEEEAGKEERGAESDLDIVDGGTESE